MVHLGVYIWCIHRSYGIGNASEPTIDFQETFVRFCGCEGLGGKEKRPKDEESFGREEGPRNIQSLIFQFPLYLGPGVDRYLMY